MNDMIDKISAFFSAFWGEYSSENEDINNIKKELFNINYSPANDKLNLRNDLLLFLKDTKKAEKKIKKELING